MDTGSVVLAAVPMYPGMSPPKTPTQSPHSEAHDGARAEQQMWGPTAGWQDPPLSPPHSNVWASPSRQPRMPQDYLNPLPSQPPSQGQSQLISPQRSSHVGRQGGTGAACSCLLPPAHHTQYPSISLSLTGSHNNNLTSAGHSDNRIPSASHRGWAGLRSHWPQRTQSPLEGRHLLRVTRQSQVWAL